MPRRWGRWLAVASVLLALLPAGGVQAQPRGLSITLQPQSGPPGTVVTIFGRAAPPFTPVRIQFAGFPSQLGCRGGRGAELLATVTSDASGQFTAQHRTARDTADQAGIMYLAGIGTQSSPESISNQVCFTFDPAPIYPQTGFRVEGDAFWDYFVARGAVETFGFPVSRTITFLGCDTQFFQRHVLQGCDGGPVRPMNLLDPGLMPVDQINFSTFPAHDPAVAAAAPAPGAPGYGQAVLSYLQAAVPNSFEGLPVGFFSAFVNSVPGDV
ncbi:MAG: hypothetical protein ACRDI2_19070, partial [Chloroflexota bacterium]